MPLVGHGSVLDPPHAHDPSILVFLEIDKGQDKAATKTKCHENTNTSQSSGPWITVGTGYFVSVPCSIYIWIILFEVL
jgi:hypothetical protein